MTNGRLYEQTSGVYRKNHSNTSHLAFRYPGGLFLPKWFLARVDWRHPSTSCSSVVLQIGEDTVLVEKGDWIIRESGDILFACEHKYFVKTYTPMMLKSDLDRARGTNND